MTEVRRGSGSHLVHPPLLKQDHLEPVVHNHICMVLVSPKIERYLGDPQHGLFIPVQQFALTLLNGIPVSPFFHPVEVPVNGNAAIWRFSHSSRFCVISKRKPAQCLVLQIATVVLNIRVQIGQKEVPCRNC